MGKYRKQLKNAIARTRSKTNGFSSFRDVDVVGSSPANKYLLARDFKKKQTERGLNPNEKIGIYSTAVQIIDKTVE